MSIENIDKETKEALEQYNWPGNVRELEHVIEYMMNVTTEEKHLSHKDMPPYLLDVLRDHPSFSAVSYDKGKSLNEIMNNYEKKVLKEALHAHGNNVAQCARSLGIRRETLYYRMHKLGINPKD